MAAKSGRGKPASTSVKARPAVTAMAIACKTSAPASSWRLAPRAWAMADTTPPPMAPADIICNSSAKGSTTAQPAIAAVPWRATSQVSNSSEADCTAASSVVGAASATMRRASSTAGTGAGTAMAPGVTPGAARAISAFGDMTAGSGAR
jgi:hypothetical protein